MPLYTNEKYRRARFLPSPFSFSPRFCSDFSLFCLSALIIGRKSTGFGRIKGLLCPSVFCYTSHRSNLVPYRWFWTLVFRAESINENVISVKGECIACGNPWRKDWTLHLFFWICRFRFFCLRRKTNVYKEVKAFAEQENEDCCDLCPLLFRQSDGAIHRRSDPCLRRICTKKQHSHPRNIHRSRHDGNQRQRPDFKRMMKDSEKREWDYILVTKKLKSCKFAFRVIRMRRQIIFLRLRSKFISTKSFVSSSVLKYGRRPSYTAFFRLYFGSNKCSRLIYQTALFARPEANRRVFP